MKVTDKGGVISTFIFMEEIMRVKIINKKSKYYGRTGECKGESKVTSDCFIVKLDGVDFSFKKEDLKVIEEAV